MVRARKSRQAAKKKTAEPNILDEISGSDVSIPSSEDDSYCSDDYEDEIDIDDDDVKMVRIILFKRDRACSCASKDLVCPVLSLSLSALSQTFHLFSFLKQCWHSVCIAIK